MSQTKSISRMEHHYGDTKVSIIIGVIGGVIVFIKQLYFMDIGPIGALIRAFAYGLIGGIGGVIGKQIYTMAKNEWLPRVKAMFKRKTKKE